MAPATAKIVRAAGAAVQRLVNVCRKDQPLYRQYPKPVAQINRTAKWLLNALARLNGVLDSPRSKDVRQ